MLDLTLVEPYRIVENVSTLMQESGELPNSPMVILIGRANTYKVGGVHFLPDTIKIHWHSVRHNEGDNWLRGQGRSDTWAAD